MGPEISVVPIPPKDHAYRLERRKYPRVNCRLDAILPDNHSVRVENISMGGLLFSDSRPDHGRSLKVRSDIALSIELLHTRGTVKVRGPLLRMDEDGNSLQAAMRFEHLENGRALEEFVQKGISDPFSHYFLAQDFESPLRDHKFLKFSKTRRMFKRIQECLLDDAYTFQQPIDMVDDATVVIDGRTKIMMSSYSYLGLLKDQRIILSSMQAIRRYGTGASGVRMLTGTTALHIELERRIAQFKNTEAAVVYSSGYLTNLAVISALFDNHDIIFADYLSHQSIFDACELSGAKIVKFKHNDMHDLETVLRNSPPAQKKLIATDAVFSMDGDVASVPVIVELAKKFNCAVMIDEAHAIGVLGKGGRGVDEHFNLPDGAIDIFMGTLSKAIPSSGGYVAGKSDLIYYLKHASNPYVFSAALSPAETAAGLKALEIIQDEPWRIRRLRENISYFVNGLRKIGFSIMNSETAIIPILIGEDRKTFLLTKMMNDRGVFVCPVVFPAVPRNRSRIRNCVMAIHTKEQLDNVLDAYKESGRILEIL